MASKRYSKFRNLGGSAEGDLWRIELRKLQKKELLTNEEEEIILNITKRLS